MPFSQEKIPSNNPFANELASQSTQQSELVCTWSVHAPQSGSSSSPLPRNYPALTATANAAGELFLFGGFQRAYRNDVYVISTRDFSTTFLKTSGNVPNPRYGHRAVLTSSILLVSGGKTDSSGKDAQNQNNDSFYLLDLGTSDIFMSRPAPAD
jgi:hypothetical protein